MDSTVRLTIQLYSLTMAHSREGSLNLSSLLALDGSLSSELF